MSMHHIAGIIILYNPTEVVINNIESYYDYIDLLIIVDNSDFKNESIVNTLTVKAKNLYIPMESNGGIALALNTGIEIARNRGFSFILTMDQDSSFSKKNISELIKTCFNFHWANVGILTPIHNHGKKKSTSNNSPEQIIPHTMTSGNILNIEAYNIVGGFDNNLFIDHVDHDYCLKLHSKKFKIIQLNNIYIKHNLGEVKEIKFLRFTIFKYISHTPLRGYYTIRNGFYVALKHKYISQDFFKENRKIVLKEILKAVFFESKKIIRLKYFLKGWIDYKKGVFGKISQ